MAWDSQSISETWEQILQPQAADDSEPDTCRAEASQNRVPRPTIQGRGQCLEWVRQVV